MFKKVCSCVVVAFIASSCALSGGSKDNGVVKYITGATKVDAVKDVHLVNIVRAIGVPSHSLVVGRYKYYQWEYSRVVGVSTIFAGGSTTFYCKLSVEARYNKIKLINWYGNQCDIFLDQINDYFKDKLNIEVIADEDSKQQVIVPKAVEPVKKEEVVKEEVSEIEKKSDIVDKKTKSDVALVVANPVSQDLALEKNDKVVEVVDAGKAVVK